MSDEAKRKRIIRLPSPRQQAAYDRHKALFDAMLLEAKDG
jgi:hypothetical protein